MFGCSSGPNGNFYQWWIKFPTLPKDWKCFSLQRGHRCVWILWRPYKSTHNSCVCLLCFLNVSTHAEIPLHKDTSWNHKEIFWWLGAKMQPFWMDDPRSLVRKYWNIFTPHLGKHNAKLTVILFVDRLYTHVRLSAERTMLWIGHNLIFVYPHATRLVQTLDVAVFGLLKLGWTTAILEWHR